MSFRKKGNSKEEWDTYCKENSDLLERTGVPSLVYKKESSFRDLLTRGVFEDSKVEFSLQTLTNEQLESIWIFINHKVPFDMDNVLFDAFYDLWNKK
jgi:hypothetical protein